MPGAQSGPHVQGVDASVVCRLFSTLQRKSPGGVPGLFEFPPVRRDDRDQANSGTSSKATMLMILISGLMAGPAVSL